MSTDIRLLTSLREKKEIKCQKLKYIDLHLHYVICIKSA